MIFSLSLLIIFVCLFMSLRLLFVPNKIKGKQVSFENFLFLAFIYVTVTIGFGLLYLLLELHGHDVLLETNEADTSFHYIERLATSIYFSAITLFSVGYGDISPVGIARGIAVFQALIGYTIPAAFVARAVIDMDKN